MKRTYGHWVKDERGVTALETAIILIAFVVVAAVFAFTILSTGTFMTERSKEAAFSGLQQVRGSVELKGSVIATAAVTGTAGTVENLIFTLANVAGGQPVDFSTDDRVVVIEYRDGDQRTQITDWSQQFLGQNDGDDLLEDRELIEISVPVDSLSPTLGINKQFSVEVKPPSGATLIVQRTTPANMELVNDLQ